MTNGDGTKIREWLIVAGLLVSLGFSVFASAKDTPTRAEMENKDAQLENRTTARLDRIENKIDRLIYLQTEANK